MPLSNSASRPAICAACRDRWPPVERSIALPISTCEIAAIGPMRPGDEVARSPRGSSNSSVSIPTSMPVRCCSSVTTPIATTATASTRGQSAPNPFRERPNVRPMIATPSRIIARALLAFCEMPAPIQSISPGTSSAHPSKVKPLVSTTAAAKHALVTRSACELRSSCTMCAELLYARASWLTSYGMRHSNQELHAYHKCLPNSYLHSQLSRHHARTHAMPARSRACSRLRLVSSKRYILLFLQPHSSPLNPLRC